jgi:hypothetical protein
MNDTATTEQPTAPAADVDWEWAIVEIFGHRRHVGKAREEESSTSRSSDLVPGRSRGPATSTAAHRCSPTRRPTSIRSLRYAEREYTPAIPFRDHGHDPDLHSDDPS